MHPAADRGRLRLLILQPTPYCNLSCDYCYLPGRDLRSRMTDETLTGICGNIFSSGLVGSDFSLVWHGGEPLSLPPSWYENAFSVIEAHRPAATRIDYGLQTNAVGLNRAWIDLFQAQGLRVGISIDGPAFLHDARRKTRKGGPSHALTMRGVRAMQDAGMPFHVIAVVTEAHLDHADAFYDFFVSQGIRDVGMNIEEIEGINLQSTLQSRNIETRFRLFFRRLLERMGREPGRLFLREATGAAGAILGGDLADENDQTTPMAILTIGVDGTASTFSPELLGHSGAGYGAFSFGNLAHESVQSIMDRISHSAIYHDILTGAQACRESCAYFRVCGGGAPANKWFETSRFDSTETLYCRLMRQVVLDEVLANMEQGLGLACTKPDTLRLEA
jgi:uncharacterized protein